MRTRAQPGNKVWHLESAELEEGYTALLCFGGGGAVLSAFTLWSVRWKDDGGIIKADQTDVVSEDSRTFLNWSFIRRLYKDYNTICLNTLRLD